MHEIRFNTEEITYRHAFVQVWYVDEDDEVEEGDNLADIETEDESIFTIKSPATGIVKRIFVEEGERVEPGELLSLINETEAEE